MANLCPTYFLSHNDMLCVFRSNHHSLWKFYKFHRITPVLECLFFLRIMKLYRHLFYMNKSCFCRNFFLRDWRHKRPKNTIDLLLFYGENFYGFSKRDLWKRRKYKHSFHKKHIYIYGHRQVLWNFILYILSTFVLSLKDSYYAQIPPYMNKALPTLGNEKEQQQIKFYEKLSGESIFSPVTKNLKMFYFTRPTGRVFKK